MFYVSRVAELHKGIKAFAIASKDFAVRRPFGRSLSAKTGNVWQFNYLNILFKFAPAFLKQNTTLF